MCCVLLRGQGLAGNTRGRAERSPPRPPASQGPRPALGSGPSSPGGGGSCPACRALGSPSVDSGTLAYQPQISHKIRVLFPSHRRSPTQEPRAAPRTSLDRLPERAGFWTGAGSFWRGSLWARILYLFCWAFSPLIWVRPTQLKLWQSLLSHEFIL